MCNCLYVEGRGASDSKGTGFSVERGSAVHCTVLDTDAIIS
jgi:hypothetical protein